MDYRVYQIIFAALKLRIVLWEEVSEEKSLSLNK